jgi:branched-chain amino acid transport system permease protein
MKAIFLALIFTVLLAQFVSRDAQVVFYCQIATTILIVAGLLKQIGSSPKLVRGQTSPLVIALLLFAIAIPYFMKNFHVFQLTQLMIYAIAIIGLNLLTGINGQFSLGHSAFYAIGAYVSAILMFHFGWSFYLTLPAAALICFVFGFLFGLPALRLEGVYLALATFALAVALPQFLKFDPLEHFTGGVQGLQLTKPAVPFGMTMTKDKWLYYVTLIMLIATFYFTSNLIKSRSGRALQAIRDNPIAAQAMGINIARYKTLAFGVSAMITGLAGSLGGIVVAFVAPDSFTFILSVTILVGMVVGGVGWMPGAIFGAAFVLFVPNIAEGISKGLSGAVYGVILILILYLMPQGLGGLLLKISNKIKKTKT